MNKADISIIVPIYNAEKYLNKCIDSIINQTKKELEILLINDGSTDNSEKIIKNYKDKRIKYYKNKNQGIGKTRNFGIEKATGKYLMFLDSDDYLEKNACEKFFTKINNNNLDIVLSNYYKVYSNGNIEEIFVPSFKVSSLKENPNILSEHLAPWAKLYRRELIVKNNIKFIEELKYEDAPFVAIALDKATKIGKVEESLVYYNIHNNSETTVRDEKVFDILKIIDIIRNYFKNKNYIKDILDILTVRIITNYTIQQRSQQDIKLGMKFIDEAFDYLKKEIPDYKKRKYYKDRSKIKAMIEKRKNFTKLYCKLYYLKNEIGEKI